MCILYNVVWKETLAWIDLKSQVLLDFLFTLSCTCITGIINQKPKTDDQIRLKPPEFHPKLLSMLQNTCTESLIRYKLQYYLRDNTSLWLQGWSGGYSVGAHAPPSYCSFH